MDGRLEAVGDKWHIRFRRRLDHPPEKVWRAVSEPEHLAAWFPQRIVGAWKIGGRLRFESEYGDFEGEVLAFEPMRLVEFTWGTDVIRLELEPDGPGSILTLIDTISELGKAARDAAGWHECLDRLEADLAGRKPGDWGEESSRLGDAYAEEFGPEASTVGPPPKP
jgi:uncharacterized protein YndB with AHSA1/START domain